MNTRSVKQQDPESKHPERGIGAFFKHLFQPKQQQASQLSELQIRWTKLVRDAAELEQACAHAQSCMLTAERARDPQTAANSVAEADRQLMRVSELLAIFRVLNQKYRAPFTPSYGTIRQIKGTTQSALNLRQRRDQFKRITGENVAHSADETIAVASSQQAVAATGFVAGLGQEQQFRSRRR